MSTQTNATRYRLGFIGGGKLAGSVMRGLVRAQFCEPAEILVSEPNESARTALRVAPALDQARLLEHLEVFGDGWLAHVERLGQFEHRRVAV